MGARFVYVCLAVAACSIGCARTGPTRDAAVEAPAATADRPFPGIRIREEVRSGPPQRLTWATVDLSDPRVSVHVSRGGADPDGEGPWQTTLMPPTEVARREGFELAVNGDFFSAKKQEGAPGGYQAGQWASVMGPAATDGAAWAGSEKPRPCLVVKRSGRVTIERLAKAGAGDAQVIAGNVMLVEKGKAVAPGDPAKHPRTVVGLDEGGTRLTMLVVDGRRKGEAEGMTYAELAKEMLAAGCYSAVNLDGGGSSVMVVREGEKFLIRNRPSDNRERPVGNVLGVDVKDGR